MAAEAEQFGPYRLDELIGRGGMGEVYRAFDTVRKRKVALKRLPLEHAFNSVFKSRFSRESALAAKLGEPHIIPIHDYGEIDGQLFIDMRLVAGRDLAQIVADAGSLALERAVDLTGQVARALDAAHRDGLIHRDVKPSNVLVSEDGGGGEFAYLIDFGISRALTAVDVTSLTATGAAIGTLAYMAPERFRDADYGCEVDVYSLGVMLFELLTGTKPFRGGEQQAVINAHLQVEPPKPSVRLPGVPSRLDHVVARSMAKDPRDRFPTAGELAAEARTAISAASVTRRPRSDRLVAPDAPTRPPQDATPLEEWAAPESPRQVREVGWRWVALRRRRARIVLAALLVGTLAVVATVLAMVGGGATPPAPGTTPPGQVPAVASTIPVLAPKGVATSPDGGRVYVTNLSYATVSVVDPTKEVINTTIPVGEQPFNVAFNPAGTMAFVTNANSDSVSIIDTASNTSVATVPVGTRPGDVDVSPDGRRAFVSNYISGTVSVIDTAALAVVATIEVGNRNDLAGLAVSPDGRRVYGTNTAAGELAVIDAMTASVVGRIRVSARPAGVALTPDGRRAYLTHPDSDTVSVVDLVAGAPIATVRVGDDPSELAIDPAGVKVYVTNFLASTVSVIDVGTDAVSSTITVGTQPAGVSVSPDSRGIFVTNSDSGTLSVVKTS